MVTKVADYVHISDQNRKYNMFGGEQAVLRLTWLGEFKNECLLL